MSQAVAIAVDLGASSGRLVAGQFDNHHLTLTELYRFENGPIHAAEQCTGMCCSSGNIFSMV